MRQFGLLIVAMAFTVGLFAQEEVAVQWGQELKEPPNTSMQKVLAHTSDGFYALRLKKNNGQEITKVFIERYDEKMNLKRSKELELKYKGKKRVFEDLVKVGEEFYLLTSFHNEAKKQKYLFQQKINRARLSISDRDLEMISVIDTKNVVRDGAFRIEQSRDSSKLLIYSQLPFEKKQPERFKLKVFGDQFEELWDRDIELPYHDGIFSVEEYQVDRAGNVYVLGIIFTDGVRKRRNGKPNYEYTILAYKNSGEDFNEYHVNLEGSFITDLTFRPANNGDLVCSGFYSERGTFSVKGTYFFKVNTVTKEIYNENRKEFDFDFITADFSNRQREKAKRAEIRDDSKRSAELYQFSLDHLILRSDGGALLIAEQFYVEEYQQSSSFTASPYVNNYRRDYYYHYNDIIVVNIRPDGSIEWASRIPKRQTTVNDGGYFSSYAMAIVRSKIYLVYNDNSRNFAGDNKSNRFYNYNGKNSMVALATVSKDGSTKRELLFPNRDQQVVTRPKICQQIGRKTMAMYGEWGRSFRFAELTFP